MQSAKIFFHLIFRFLAIFPAAGVKQKIRKISTEHAMTCHSKGE
jgi:hypothetical protein